MEIKMKTTMAGPDGSALAGATITVDNKTGKELVAGGYGEDVTPPPKKKSRKRKNKPVETATAADAPETAGAGPQARKPGVIDRLLGKGGGA